VLLARGCAWAAGACTARRWWQLVRFAIKRKPSFNQFTHAFRLTIQKQVAALLTATGRIAAAT